MAERQQRAGRRHPRRIPTSTSLSSFIGVDGTNTTLNSGPHADQPEAARASARRRASEIIRRLQRDDRSRSPASPSTCSRSQDLTIDSTVSRTQYQFVLRGRQPGRLRRLGAAAGRAPDAACPSSPTSPATLQNKGLSAYRQRSTATPRRASASPPATIDNALYDAFGQRIVSTIFTQSNQYRVILEADPRMAALARLARQPLSAAARPPASRCRCRPSPPSSERTAPLQVNHLGQFPADHHLLRPGARRLARRRRSTRSQRREQEIGLPRQHPRPLSRARRSPSRRRSATSCC